MLYPTLVTTEDELQRILQLQQLYLKGHNSQSEEKEQGFLTVHHSYEMLHQMHLLSPSVIIKDGEKVIAYALVMAKELKGLIPVLKPMFDMFENVSYKNQPLNSYHYYVIGQICVAKEYRGMGVFDMLYQKHKAEYSGRYDFTITEIATSNGRSMRAHERVGFKTIYQYSDATDEWNIVLWDWS